MKEREAAARTIGRLIAEYGPSTAIKAREIEVLSMVLVEAILKAQAEEAERAHNMQHVSDPYVHQKRATSLRAQITGGRA